MKRRRSTVIVVSVSTLLVLSCATDHSEPQGFMPAPEITAAGIVDSLSSGVLYATTRRRAPPNGNDFYLNESARRIDLGMARVAPAGEDPNPGKTFAVAEVEPLGSLVASGTPGNPWTATGKFTATVDSFLADSPTREITIYIHGFCCGFDKPVTIAGEYGYYLGDRGAFIAFCWPSRQKAVRYLTDVECAVETADAFCRFIEYLARETTALRINIVAHSTGVELLTTALYQMTSRYASVPETNTREATRLGKVIFIAGDVERSKVKQLVEEGDLHILESLIVYMSQNDAALEASEFIRHKPRIGQTWPEGTRTRPTIDILCENDKIAFIDVTDAAGSHGAMGHEYFRENPWVSSDILSYLAFDLDPATRGLVQRDNNVYWSFPENYIERLRSGILENVDLTE